MILHVSSATAVASQHGFWTPKVVFRSLRVNEHNRYLLGQCSKADCQWNSWSSWSSSCGAASRSRSIGTKMVTVAQLSCEGVKTACDEKPQLDDRKIKCENTFYTGQCE